MLPDSNNALPQPARPADPPPDGSTGEQPPPAQLARLQRLAMLGELAAELTHEIRQPLAAIRNFAEAALRIVRNQAPLTAQQQNELEEALATIFVQAGRAQQLTRAAQSLGQPAARAPIRLAMHELIEGILPLIEFEAEQRQVELTMHCHEPLPDVIADRLELEQVLVNLLRNAVEAAAVGQGPDRTVSVKAAREGDAVRIDVRDTGAGISAEDLPRIFQRYFTTKPQGTGLGLAISRTLIEAHQGRLWVTRNEDRGVTFHITLPAAE